MVFSRGGVTLLLVMPPIRGITAARPYERAFVPSSVLRMPSTGPLTSCLANGLAFSRAARQDTTRGGVGGNAGLGRHRSSTTEPCARRRLSGAVAMDTRVASLSPELVQDLRVDPVHVSGSRRTPGLTSAPAEKQKPAIRRHHWTEVHLVRVDCRAEVRGLAPPTAGAPERHEKVTTSGTGRTAGRQDHITFVR